ncbi:MAG TPA: hypothetical protein VNW94_15965 [Streptosporangiaceae bacterium]|nr:hypothetical protein [Streptosporangiaceae bacterium]
MKKKIVAVGLLAGSIALTGLGGAAYADGGATAAGPAKPHRTDGKRIAIACISKGGPGKPGTFSAPGVSGGSDKPVFATTGGPKGLPFPPAGAKVLRSGGGGGMIAVPPPGGKLPKGAVKIDFNGPMHTLKIAPGSKGVRCFEVPGGPGALPPGGDNPPLPPVKPTP